MQRNHDDPAGASRPYDTGRDGFAMADLEAASFSADYLLASDVDESPKLHMKANYFITGHAWYTIMALPEWGPLIHEYLKYLSLQSGPPEARAVGREIPEELIESVASLAAAARAGQTDRALKAGAMAVGAGILSVASPCVLPVVPIVVTGSEDDIPKP